MKFRPSLMMVALELAFGATIGARPAYANPSGAAVVAGSASFAQPAHNVLQVTNTPGTIINWQHFSIARGEITRFVQQSAQSAVLNRVVGGNLSQIMGTLQSNGQVFLVNPSGIVIGPNAVIDTQGFVASTLAINDADFINERLRFTAGLSAGEIRNEGLIRTAAGGRVALIAPQIENSGIIDAPGGEVILAAGRTVTLSDATLGGVSFEVQAPEDRVLNLGTLSADGGTVGVFAGTLKHSGQIRADRLEMGDDGSILLVASSALEVSESAVVQADGHNGLDGGSITLQANAGTAQVAGTLSAQSEGGQGGDIDVLGDSVQMGATAVADASGDLGGGTLRIGGDFQGSNADVRNASGTDIAAGAVLRADARDSGDGGRVIVWADRLTRFGGALSARGGAAGGNGGFAEVSGKQTLVFADGATVDLSAAQGTHGKLLLDPLDIIVASTGGQVIEAVDELCDFVSNCGEGWRDLEDNLVTIKASTLAALNADVTLQASNNIFVFEDIALTAPGASLTLMAGMQDAASVGNDAEGAIWQAGNITTQGGAVTLSGRAIYGAGNISTGGGALSMGYLDGATLGATGSIQHSGQLSTGAGAVTMNSQSSISLYALTTTGGAVAISSTQGSLSASSITAGGGDVDIDAAYGVSMTTLSSAGGEVSVASSAGSVYVSSVTAARATLQAAGYVSATVDGVSGRVDAASSNSSVYLYTGSGKTMQLGTVSTTGSAYLSSGGGIRQASDGLVSAGYVSISNSGGTVGTAGAALQLKTASLGLSTSEAAYLNFSNAVALTSLSIEGTMAALASSVFTGVPALGMTLGQDDGVLTHSLTDSSLTSFSLSVRNGGLSVSLLDAPDTRVSYDASGDLVISGPASAQTLSAYADQALRVDDVAASSITLSAYGDLTTGVLGGASLSLRSYGGDILFERIAASSSLYMSAAGNIDTSVERDGYDIEAGSAYSLSMYAGGGIGSASSLAIDAGSASVTLNATQGIGTADQALLVATSGSLYLDASDSINVVVGSTDGIEITPLSLWLLDIDVGTLGDGQIVRVEAQNVLVDLSADAAGGLAGTASSSQRSTQLGYFRLTAQDDLSVTGDFDVQQGLALSAGGNLSHTGMLSTTYYDIRLSADGNLSHSGAITSTNYGSIYLDGQNIDLSGGDIWAYYSVDVYGQDITLDGAVTARFGSIDIAGQNINLFGSDIAAYYDVNVSGLDIVLDSAVNAQYGSVSLSGRDLTFVESPISAGNQVSLYGRNIFGSVDHASWLSVSASGEFDVHVSEFSALSGIEMTVYDGAFGRIRGDADILSYLAAGTGMALGVTPSQSLDVGFFDYSSATTLKVDASTRGGMLNLYKGSGDIHVGRIRTGGDASAGSVELQAGSGSIYAADEFGGGTIDLSYLDANDTPTHDDGAYAALYAYNGSLGLADADAGVYGGTLNVSYAGGAVRLAAHDAMHVNSTAGGDLYLTVDAGGSGMLDVTHSYTDDCLGCSFSGVSRNADNGTVTLTGVNSDAAAFSLDVDNGSLLVAGDVAATDLTLQADADMAIEASTTARTVESSGSLRLYAGGTLSVRGGSSAGASVLVHSGDDMDIDADSLQVSGGGSNASVSIDAGGSMYVSGGTVSVQGGSSAGASVLMRSGDDMEIDAGSLLVNGGSGAGAFASVEAGGSMNVSASSAHIQGGSGSGAHARMHAGSGQSFYVNGLLSLMAGSGAASYAGLTATGCTSYYGCGGYYYGGQYVSAGSLQLSGSTTANAFISQGLSIDADGYNVATDRYSDQYVYIYGDVSIEGGFGSAASFETGIKQFAVGYQYIYAYGDLNILTRSDTVSVDGTRAEVGIRNEGGSGQSVYAANILIRNQAGIEAAAGIDDVTGAWQTVSAAGDIVIDNASTSGFAGITAQSAGVSQSVTLSGNPAGAIVVDASGGGVAQIFSAGYQDIDASSTYDDEYYYNDYYYGLFSGNSHGTISVGSSTSAGQSGIVSLGEQRVFAGDISVIGGANGAATSEIRAGGMQSIDAWNYSPTTRGFSGGLTVGSLASVGASGIVSGASQEMVVGKLDVIGGSASSALASVEATTEMTISTLAGGIRVQAGSGGSAKIDPPVVNIVSSGGIDTIAGGAGTSATIVGGTSLNTAALGGNVSLIGAPGAFAGFDSAGVLNVVAANDIVVAGEATFSAPGGGSVRVGSPVCSGCSSGFRGGAFSFGGLRGGGIIVAPIDDLPLDEQGDAVVADLLALLGDQQERRLFDEFSEIDSLTTASGEDTEERKVGACR